VPGVELFDKDKDKWRATMNKAISLLTEEVLASSHMLLFCSLFLQRQN
jgi:hypothetical protein